jgi:hypothetical protein
MHTKNDAMRRESKRAQRGNPNVQNFRLSSVLCSFCGFLAFLVNPELTLRISSWSFIDLDSALPSSCYLPFSSFPQRSRLCFRRNLYRVERQAPSSSSPAPQQQQQELVSVSTEELKQTERAFFAQADLPRDVEHQWRTKVSRIQRNMLTAI